MLFVVLLSFTSYAYCTDSIAVNLNTGVIYPLNYPIYARKGDDILLCPMPPLSEVCMESRDDICMTSHTACIIKRFDMNIDGGSVFQMNKWKKRMKASNVQPGINPSVHCFVMNMDSGQFWETCMDKLEFGLRAQKRAMMAVPMTLIDGNDDKNVRILQNYTRIERELYSEIGYNGGTIIVGKRDSYITQEFVIFEFLYGICFIIYYIYINVD